jgi:hypothetical protein
VLAAFDTLTLLVSEAAASAELSHDATCSYVTDVLAAFDTLTLLVSEAAASAELSHDATHL